MKKIKTILKKIKDKIKKINYDRWSEILTIIIEIMFVIALIVIYFNIQDLYTKYNELNFKLYEIKRGIND